MLLIQIVMVRVRVSSRRRESRKRRRRQQPRRRDRLPAVGVEEGALEIPHVGRDRRHRDRRGARVEATRIETRVRVRIRHRIRILKRRRRRSGDRCERRRADLLEAHAGCLGLRRPGRRRRGGASAGGVARRGAGELLDDAAEVVLADVVHLRLRRWGRLVLLQLRRQRRRMAVLLMVGRLVERAFSDGLAVLVHSQVLLLLLIVPGLIHAAIIPSLFKDYVIIVHPFQRMDL